MPRTLTPGDGQDLLASLKRALERRDVDATVALYREDAEVRIDPFAEPLVGAAAIRAYWNEVVAGQTSVDFDAERVWVVERTVLASWHGAYTRPADSERVRVRGFMTLEVDEEGLVQRQRRWSAERAVGHDTHTRSSDGR